MRGIFIPAYPTAICWCLSSELNRWPGCPWSSFSCPQGWPQGVVGAVSFWSPILSTSSLERWCLHPLSLQKWTKGFEAPQEEKSLQGVSALLLPWAAWQQALPHCCYPPWSKKGKRKIRLGLRSLDLPVFSWLREITSHFQSQREIFIRLSLLKEDELWLGEKTREVLPINKVSISEKYDLNSWLNEYLGSSWAPGCGICTLGFNPPCSS